LEACMNPAIASELSLQPLKRYDLDAAIIFSDILIPCVAMGQTLTFDAGHGPKLAKPVRTASDVRALISDNIAAKTHFVGEAITKTRKQLRPEQAMIGFAGAPFTVASYMIEGQGTKDFSELKNLLYREPETFTKLIETIAHVTTQYVEMQIQHGAD